MRSYPHLVHPSQTKYSSAAAPPQGHMHDLTPKSKHKRHLIGGPYMPHQRSFSSSEEDIQTTPDFDGESEFFFSFYSVLFITLH